MKSFNIAECGDVISPDSATSPDLAMSPDSAIVPDCEQELGARVLAVLLIAIHH